MIRNLWFQLHWLLGVTAGTVLALVGVTGGILSFEEQIIEALNPQVTQVSPGEAAALSPDQLRTRIQEQAPDRQINWLSLQADPEAAAQVNFAGGGRRGTTVYVDPYSGELLGQTSGDEFFHVVMRLHRWLLAGDVGKQVVGASTVALVVLALSGLYLRWPRRLSDWRAWLTFSFRHRGRSFLWNLHAAIGTWVLPLYLLASLTGLYWSYEWYRDGLYSISGVERQARGPRGGDQAPPQPYTPQLDGGWQGFLAAVDGYSLARLQLPERPDQPLQIRYLDADPAHERANNSISLDPASGAVVEHQRYDERPLNERLMASIFPLHAGSYFGLPGLILMMLASLLMPLFTITGWMLYLDRRRKKQARRAAAEAAGPAPAGAGKPVLVAYASQSGTAERYAWLSAGTLRAAGVPVTVRPLAGVRPEELGGFERALFALATFGDGEAPDNARAFARRMAQAAPSLSELRYGLLALGDRTYERYCGFGREVADWLHRRGAQPLFDPVEVDADDDTALAQWRQRLGKLTGAGDAQAWQEAAFQPWRLVERRELNPGSAGAPVFHLRLIPATEGKCTWQAGDLAEIAIERPGAERLVREYSIASIPEDGAIELLVRQAQQADGSLGAGSGLLTAALAEGGELPLRIRSNAGFHAPREPRPLVLIGNGTGIAGLRAHLKARARAGEGRNWLIFGERNAASDFHYREELEDWQRRGLLERVDLAFSRDQPDKRYVQHCLAAQGERLRQWLADGAAIYVCGSLTGMAPAVEAVLVELIGRQELERLTEAGRYRRDVY